MDSLNLSAPTTITFLISLALAIIALIAHFVKIDFITLYQFWIAIAAYVLLAIGCLVKGV